MQAGDQNRLTLRPNPSATQIA